MRIFTHTLRLQMGQSNKQLMELHQIHNVFGNDVTTTTTTAHWDGTKFDRCQAKLKTEASRLIPYGRIIME